MVTYENLDNKIGEINLIAQPAGITLSNMVYSGERVVAETMETQDNTGHVKTETAYGGKVLP